MICPHLLLYYYCVQAALGAWSDVPKAHFLRLMNCMHHRELQGSLDSLHRHFDYAVRRGEG